MTRGQIWLESTWPFVQAALPDAPAEVIEIGCGTAGGFVPFLLQAGYTAVGIDPQAPEGPDYRTMEFENYQPPRPVDAIVASTSLHHVADLDLALNRLTAALRPGGTAIVIEWASERFDEPTAHWCFARLPAPDPSAAPHQTPAHAPHHAQDPGPHHTQGPAPNHQHSQDPSPDDHPSQDPGQGPGPNHGQGPGPNHQHSQDPSPNDHPGQDPGPHHGQSPGPERGRDHQHGHGGGHDHGHHHGHQDEEGHSWLVGAQQAWLDSGQPWSEFLAARRAAEGMHTAADVIAGLNARLHQRSCTDGPYVFPDLDNTTEADEQSAINAGQIQPTSIRYTATKPPA